MAYQNPAKPYQQISPTFTPGYHYEDKYHNIGQLQTPYIGKWFGQEGDYAPPQRVQYYTPQNPTYPYVLDKDFNATQFLPTEGSCFGNAGYFPCYQTQYPAYWALPDYFSPHTRYPRGHQPSNPKFDIFTNEVDSQGQTQRGVLEPSKENYKKLPVAHPNLKGTLNFYPFNNYY